MVNVEGTAGPEVRGNERDQPLAGLKVALGASRFQAADDH